MRRKSPQVARDEETEEFHIQAKSVSGKWSRRDAFASWGNNRRL